jgi:hypothetical protein
MASASHGKFSLVAANTVTVRIIQGGRYMFSAKGTWGGGNVKLQMPLPDSSATYGDVPSSTLSADGHLFLDLPPGQVKAVVTTATAVDACLTHVPL